MDFFTFSIVTLSFGHMLLDKKEVKMSLLSSMVVDLETPKNLSLILATVWIIVEKYAVYTRSPLTVGQYAETKKSHLEHEDLINEILKRTSDSLATRFLLEADISFNQYREYHDLIGNTTGQDYIYHIHNKKETAIWFLDSIKSYNRLEIDLKNERWNYQRNGFFCIIYTGREHNRLTSVKEIFKKIFSQYVINVNALMSFGKSIYVYTYFPFSPKRCHDSTPHLIGFIGPSTNFTLNTKNFFPKKLTNMWQCPLRVTTWNQAPFMHVNFKNNSGTNLHLSGIEGMLLMLLSDYMNFSMKLVPNPEKDRGYIYPNGTSTGATKMIVDDVTDIFISCLMYEMKRIMIAQPSYIYLNIPINIAIPKGRTMTPFERLLKPFKHIVWSCLCITIFFSIVIIYGLKLWCKRYIQEFVFGASNRSPFTFFWSIFYGIPIHGTISHRNFARYLFLLWTIFTFIIRTAYIGELFIIFRDSRARTTLKSISQAVDKGFTFYTFPTLTGPLFATTSKSINIKFVDSTNNTLSKLLKRLDNSKAKFVLTVLNHIILDFNQRSKNRFRQVQYLQRPLLISPITFYMRKHSYLSFEVNEILMKILAAGLIEKFEDNNLGRIKQKVRKTQKPQKLSLWLLMGVFAIYFALLLMCTIVFILEKFTTQSIILKKIIDFLNI